MFERGVETSSLLSRRQALTAVGAALVPQLFTGTAHAQKIHPPGFWNQPRSLWLRRPDTGEEIRTTYWADGQMVASEFRRLSWFLRDVHMHRRIATAQAQGRAVPQDWYAAVQFAQIPLDVMYAIGGWLEHFDMSRPLIINSAFRHPLTNSAIEGASKNSFHTRGGAVDVVVPGVASESVSQFAQWLRAGGVGFYPSKHFTHVDEGHSRTWVHY